MGVLEYKLSELEEKGIIYWNDDERYEINEGHEPNKRNE